jgi:flagellar basal-body rod protein FlgC
MMRISYLTGMNVSASGLAAQRAVMDAAAENLANAQTTRTPEGGPYRRKVVPLTAEAQPFVVRTEAEASPAGLVRTDPDHLGSGGASPPAEQQAMGVAARVEEDPSEGTQVYDPGHPDADAGGMVRMPNVDTAREMVTLMVASRAYEANLAALQASRRLAEASLNLAR